MDQNAASMGPPSFDASMSSRPGPAQQAAFDAATLVAVPPLQLVQPTVAANLQTSALGSTIEHRRSFDPSTAASPSEAEASIRSRRLF